MSREEIIAMAREAGFRTGQINLSTGDPVPFIAPASGTSCMVELERFAALVAAKAAADERAACARVCEGFKQGNSATYIDDDWADMCAAAIRESGKP